MNLPTIIVLAVVVLVFAAIIANEIRKKKAGKSSCSCGGCSGCGLKDQCHGTSEKK